MTQFAARMRVRLMRSLGWPGAIGLASLALAVAVLGWARLAGARLDVDAKALAARSLAVHAAARGPAAGASAVALPAPDRRDEDLRRLLAIASQSQVEVLGGDYGVGATGSRDAISGSLPLRGSYRALRTFALRSLAELPNLALDELHLERPASTAAVLDARLRFTLFYGAR